MRILDKIVGMTVATRRVFAPGAVQRVSAAEKIVLATVAVVILEKAPFTVASKKEVTS